MGSKDKTGFLKQFFVYALLICVGFIYMYPILHMISSSMMSLDDLLDSSIKWIPSWLNFSNLAHLQPYILLYHRIRSCQI